MTVNDCDREGLQHGRGGRRIYFALVSLADIEGPRRVSTCTFVTNGYEPKSEDFVITTEDAAGTNKRPLNGVVEVVVVPRG